MSSTYTVLQSKLAAYGGCFQDKATQAYGPAVTQPGLPGSPTGRLGVTDRRSLAPAGGVRRKQCYVGCLQWLLSGQGHSGLRPCGHPAAGSPPGRLGVTDRRSLAPTGITVSEGSSVQSITGLELVHER